MPAFTDANGREWKVSLDAYKIRDVRAEVKFDLAPKDMNPFDDLESDPVKVADVLWVLVREQAPEGYTARNFGEALNGDAMAVATQALVDAVVNFSHPQRRGLLRKALEATTKARQAGADLALSKIGDPTILEAMKEATARRMDEEIQRALTGLKSASSTPGSLG